MSKQECVREGECLSRKVPRKMNVKEGECLRRISRQRLVSKQKSVKEG